MLTLLAKLLKALNSEASPAQISLALVLGMYMGLLPDMTPLAGVILFLALVIRINLSAFVFSTLIFSMFSYLMDPIMDQTGEYLLTHQAAQSLWTTLYQQDFWRLLHFNHTLTLGGLVVALLLSLPLYLFSVWATVRYRSYLLQWVLKSRFMQLLKATTFFKIYQRL